MVLAEKRYTVEDFRQYARENEDLRLELDDGVIIDMGASRPINTITAMRIGYFFSAFVLPRNLGHVSGADGGYKVGPRKVRQPDVAFVAVDEIPQEFDFAPDLAVEIVSPGEDVFKKTNDYLQAGTRIVWAVYPDEKNVFVFHMDDDGTIHSKRYEMGDTLDGGDVLPGFTLPVGDIFAQ